MFGNKRLLLLGAVIFVLGILLMFPARVATSLINSNQFQLGAVTGTLWNGRAGQGQAGDVYLSELSWQFKPLSLFLGRLAFDTSVRTAAGRVDGYAAIGLTGAITLQNLSGSLSLAAIHPAIRANGVDGTLNLQLERVVLADGLPSEAIGTVSVGNLTTRAFGQDALGNFRADVSTDEKGIVAVVADAGAVIGLDGTASLQADRSYLFTGTVAARDETPPVIEQNLRFLGSADEQGRRQFRFEGAL